MDLYLRDVPPNWRSLFDLGLLASIVDRLPVDRITPPISLVFEAFRYGGPDDITTVIIGQDPYPGAGEAQGLCFSVPDGAVPESLKRIYGCLDRAGLRRGHTDPSGKPIESGDLRPWAVQGILMLNSALTTLVGSRRAHADEWEPFVGDFVGRFCAAREEAGRPLHFLLWGNDARAYSTVARDHGHIVHEWTHPSPLADNRASPCFRECRHFEEVNGAISRPIVWDNLAPVVAFSDGACLLNGAPGARASFASLVFGGQFRATIIRGEIRPNAYAFADAESPERGIIPTETVVAPSNNRGELTGLIYCCLALLKGRALGRVEIISDSEICVKTLLEWLPTRRRKGTAHELKNFDLVAIAERLLAELRKQAVAVAVTHTRSHQPRPPDGALPRERFVWAGNDRADANATEALREADRVRVISGPTVLACLNA